MEAVAVDLHPNQEEDQSIRSEESILISRIIERARQRQELLAQKLGETPEAVPRKRRTPLVDDDSQNVPPPNIADDDSPKRHCSREKLQEVKPDTPAISSVRSRLNALASQRSQWSATDSGEESENSGPPPRQRYEPSEDDLPRDPPSRKSRLANLAQTINCWEDDLSHPTIQKEEPQKARWRPPKPAEPEKPAEPTSSRQRDRIFSGGHNKGKAPSPPTETTNPSSERSTKYHAPPPPPPAPPLPDKRGKSPKKLSPPKPALNRMVSPAKPLRCEIRVNLNQEPINIQEVRDSGEETDEPTKKPVTARMAKWAEKTASTPTKATDPAQQPLSARFAKWEERTQTPTKPPVPKPMLLNTPKQTFPVQKFNSASKATAAPSPATKFNPPKLCSSETKVKVNKPRDSEDPASKPVSERMAKWQQKVEGDKPDPKDDEPTAYSVTARMSAWEHMSSSNQVSYVKKVEPGTSPAKAPASTPPCSPAAKTPRSGSKKSEAKTTPSGKKNLKPQKSFVESIMEKASEIRSPYKGTEEVHEGRAVNPVEKPPRARNPSSQSPGKTKTTPSKRDTHAEKGASPDDALSPTHASAAMKSIHQRLMEQTSQSTTSQTMAERLRQERMQELASIQNRWQNGILREDSASDTDHQPQYQQQQAQETSSDHSPPKMQRLSDVINSKEEKKEQIRAKAREDSASSQEDEPVNQSEQRYRRPSSKKPTPPAPPRMKFAVATPTSEKRGNQQKQPVSSLLQLVRKGSHVKSAAPVNRQTFDDGFDSDGSESTESSRRKSQCSVDSDIVDTQDETEPTESQDSLAEDSSFEKFKGNIEDEPVDEGDDVSLSAFVPASVRRQSVLPTNDRHSLTSQSSSEDVQRLKSVPSKSPKATKSPKTTKTDSDHYVFHSSTFDVKSMMQRNEYGQSSASLNSTASTASEVSIGETYEERRKYYESEETETDADEEGRDDVDDYLDEALDEKPPVAAPRKRRSHMMATQSNEGDCPLMYSVSMYRSKKRFDTRPPPKMVIKRNREVTEDELEMPPLPRQAPARSLEERIRELTELGNQELSVIKQASNALNQCCLGNSTFAGSAEQAECNRLLLISSQRRMAYMSEIQRLRDERTLEEDTSGPKGSLTISEMRLPLKREFVTKLGTAADSAVHYFIILIRNGSHIIVTEMLSTHDERMRGSLDFPNHINVNNITGSFQVQLEIYGMSIVREVNSKDKKKNKTPKKNKKDLRILQSPGGPNAVMTSSFKLIATLPITMKSVDKACFNLEKVPYVSPVYGTIYMRLKCTKEASVVERGFLTLFEDVSGLGAWHRRWCLLSSNKICFWKYPDEETKKEPLGYIDLKRCITEKVGLLPRDICARKDTFELVTVRQPRKGEQDTLVSKTYSTMTTVKHMLSADTKEERILWCNKINRALINIRTWHPEAARPIKGTVKH